MILLYIYFYCIILINLFFYSIFFSDYIPNNDFLATAAVGRVFRNPEEHIHQFLSQAPNANDNVQVWSDLLSDHKSVYHADPNITKLLKNSSKHSSKNSSKHSSEFIKQKVRVFTSFMKPIGENSFSKYLTEMVADGDRNLCPLFFILVRGVKDVNK